MEHHIQVPKTARYFTNADPADQDTIWFVFHRYGQLAEYFIRKFSFLDPSRNLVVAPEGMHRFYLEGFRGRVGASWMSKVDRLNDISDNIAMLNMLLHKVQSEMNSPKQVRVIAFSQGVATAVRWILDSKIDTQDLILWGGVFPPDVDFEKYRSRLADLNLQVVVGDQDQFYLGENQKKLFASLSEHSIPFELRVVPGVHDIASDSWQALRTQLDK